MINIKKISYKPLKAHMGANDIKITKLSKATGVCYSVLNDTLNGRNNGSLQTILKISEALGLPIQDIIKIEEASNEK